MHQLFLFAAPSNQRETGDQGSGVQKSQRTLSFAPSPQISLLCRASASCAPSPLTLAVFPIPPSSHLHLTFRCDFFFSFLAPSIDCVFGPACSSRGRHSAVFSALTRAFSVGSVSAQRRADRQRFHCRAFTTSTPTHNTALLSVFFFRSWYARLIACLAYCHFTSILPPSRLPSRTKRRPSC